MSEIDQRADILKRAFAETRPILLKEDLSEADVRAKLIDPLFALALGWPERLIRREPSTDAAQRLDYLIGEAPNRFVVEAKRASRFYTIPELTIRKTHRIKALAAGDEDLRDDIRQLATYCLDTGIPYAVLSNGIQLLAFLAIRTDRPWMQGEALVFSSVDELIGRFSELWGILSYPAVNSGQLATYFSFPDETPKHRDTVLAHISNPDEKLIRNHLHSDLIPVLRAVFEDLTDERQGAILDSCYVYSDELRSTADDFIIAIQDLPPSYLRGQVASLSPSPHDAGKFQDAIRRIANESKRGTVLLLLGGIGAGKTTFLRQVRVRYCRDVIENDGAYYYVDFRDAPEQPPFQAFVYSTLRRQLNVDLMFLELCRKLGAQWNPENDALSAPGVVALLFARELDQATELAKASGITNQDRLADLRYERLRELTANDGEVVRKAFRSIEAAGRFIVVTFDNADQLDIDYQLQIFLLAQHVAADTGANILVALREEKYYLASQKGAFGAFHTQKFHVPSPKLTDVLARRLRYALDHLDSLTPDASSERRREIRDFLEAIGKGGVGGFGRRGSSNVVRLLERVCLGNVRLALRMFRAFVMSGNTNVHKIIRIYRENVSRQRVPYHVPFHEFVKSVMLQDRRFYRETDPDNEVLNLFSVSPHPPSSHLTGLRLLAFLMQNSVRTSDHGRGYVDLDELLGIFVRVFGDSEDARFHLSRMLKTGVVEADTGVTDTLKVCRAVRASAAGEYYLTFLARAFAYLDLIWIDTALTDQATLSRLQPLAYNRDQEARFERVDLFLRYLIDAEQEELKVFPSLDRVPGWEFALMPSILKQVEREKHVIATKFAKYWTEEVSTFT